ncbi:MAG: DUF6036 family nucleotidyltransferase [Thermoanaerobaculia bacterium]
MKNFSFLKDIEDFLILLFKHQVKYLIVGGEAVIYYGYARITGDIDIFYENSEENCKKLFEALYEFWKGKIPGIKDHSELMEPKSIFQFGVPPNRIDLINYITKISFKSAWEERVCEKLKVKNKNFKIYYIGLKDLIKNKNALKRPKDLEDLKYLNKIKRKRLKKDYGKKTGKTIL